MAGIASKSVARLQPNKDEMKPNINDPNRIPIALNEPIHEICSFVNGPDKSGVSSVAKSARAGEMNPASEPCVNEMPATVEKSIKLFPYSMIK